MPHSEGTWLRLGLGAALLAMGMGLPALPTAAASPPTLTMASTTDITTLDPILSGAGEVQFLANVYQGLTYADATGSTVKVEPQLATSWTHSANGLVWTFQLRHNVYFQDGSLMNSEDVIRALKANIPIAGLLFASVKSMEPLGPYAIRFTLKYPMRLDFILTAEYDAWIVGPKAVSKPQSWYNAGRSDGTGPYEIVQYKPGQDLVLKAFPRYWGGWKPDQYQTVICDLVSTPTTEQQMLEGGQAQLAYGIPEVNLTAVKADPSLAVHVGPSWLYYLIYWDTQEKPLNNPLVRQALDYAIPYSSLIKVATAGYGQPLHGPLPAGVYPQDPSLVPYTYNLAKARQLLKQAGYPHGGFTITLMYAASNGEESLFTPLIKEAFKNIGVNVDLRPVAAATSISLAQSGPSPNHDAFILQNWPTYGDDWIDLYWDYSCYHPYQWNFAYYCSPTLDKLLNTATADQVTAPTKAAQLYDAYDSTLFHLALGAWLYQDASVIVTNRSVQGYVDNPAYPNVVFFYPLHQG